MNPLLTIFENYFTPFYYYNNSGRAYIEHSCSSLDGYHGRIGFFHFSLYEKNKNIFFNYQIYKFIEEYYRDSFGMVQELCEYCIKQGIILSIISIDELTYCLRVSEGDKCSRDIIAKIYKSISGEEFISPHQSFTCPIELLIGKNDVGEYSLSLHLYQKTSLPENIYYQKNYLEEENIFLTIFCKKYTKTDNIGKSYLFKLYEPLKMESSSFLYKKYYEQYLYGSFLTHELYVNCIERRISEDIIYFTKNYKIEA